MWSALSSVGTAWRVGAPRLSHRDPGSGISMISQTLFSKDIIQLSIFLHFEELVRQRFESGSYWVRASGTSRKPKTQSLHGRNGSHITHLCTSLWGLTQMLCLKEWHRAGKGQNLNNGGEETTSVSIGRRIISYPKCMKDILTGRSLTFELHTLCVL